MEKALLLYKVVDGTATEFPSATAQLKLSGFTYKAARMGGAPTITGTIKSATSLEGQWDDVFVTFNNERFYVRTEPDNTKDNSEIQESYNITFYSQRYELDNVYMIDAVQSDSSIDGYQSNSTRVQFMGDIAEWAARLNASFGYSGLTSEGWSVVVDSGITSEDKLISFEDKFVSEALQEGFSAYNIPYYFVGKVIHFGYTSNAISTPFEYGAANSLLSIQKNNANYKIVNRCFGYGSGDNLPYYYPNTSPKGTVSAEAGSSNVTLSTSDITVFNTERFANKVSTTDTISYIKPVLTFNTKQVELYDETAEDYGYITPSNNIIADLRQKTNQYAIIPIKLTVTANMAGTYKIIFPVSVNGTVRELSALQSVIIDDIDVTNSVTLNANDSSFETYLSSGNHTIYYTVSASIFGQISHLQQIFNIVWSYDSTAEWYNGTTKISDLSTIGVRVSVTPTSGDTFHQVVATGSYIAPVDTLMPPVFRSSSGVTRFYNALNNTYQKPDGSGYYTFNHPYDADDRREQTVSFDEIKPTITGMTNAASQAMDKFLAFAWDTNDNDEIDPDTGKYVHPYFFAKLPKYDGTNGFNLFDCSSESGTMTISMKSGVCGACEFEIHVGEETQKNTVQVDSSGNLLRNDKGEVRCGCESLGQPKETPQDRQNDTQNYEVWIALAKDGTTYPTVMPSHQRGLDPTTNDTFVILNITLPQAYITAAEEKLKQEIIAYMASNNDEKFSFSIGFSRIYLENNSSVLSQLNENARLTVRYHSVDRTFYISNYTYSMKEGELLPDISVDLVDELTTSTNSLQQRIDAVKQDLLNSIDNGDTLKTGLKYFLRKDVEDYAKEIIHFAKGATFGSYTEGTLGAGGAVSIDVNGNSYAEFDYLTVRKKAIFQEVNIDKLQSVGGTLLISPASIVIKSVTVNTDYYRCFFDTVDSDGRTINNAFSIGDFARCQTFNITASKYYWRKVVGVGKDYIDLSRVSGEYDSPSDAPEAGDCVVTLGSATDTDRRAAIAISAYGTGTPSIKMYSGISSLSLTNKDIFGIEYDETTHAPFLYNYGSMYFGARGQAGNYISFNGSTFEIHAKVELSAGSSGMENLSEWDDVDDRITSAQSDADAAQSAADTAQATATAAQTKMNSWTADDKISPMERLQIKDEKVFLESDYDYCIKNAGIYYISYSALTTAKTNYLSDLNTILNATPDANGNVPVPDNFSTHANAYYTARTTLLESVSTSTSEKYFEIEQDVSRVYNVASGAQTTATEANDRMDGWIADGVLSKAELRDVRQENNFLISDNAEIVYDATKYSLTSETAYTAYVSAYTTYHSDVENAISGTGSYTPDEDGNVPIPTNFAAHQSAYYTARTNILKLIYDTIKNKFDSLDSDISDLDFLTNAFSESTAYVSGGLILGSLIGVRDSQDNVLAGMNGSRSTDVGYDATHGTLMLFAGVPSGSTSFSSRIVNSAFRVYGDGYVYANHLIASGATLTTADVSGKITSSEGTIGGFTIGANRIYYTPPTGSEGNGFVSLYNDGIVFNNTEVNRFGSEITFCVGTDTALPAVVGYSSAMFISNIETEGDMSDTPYGCSVRVSATNAWETCGIDISASGGVNQNYAIYCHEGVYAGFRFATKILTSSNTLLDTDNVIVCGNSSAVILTLPDSPKDGQFYMIVHPSASQLTVTSSATHPIERIVSGNVTWTTSCNSTTGETMVLWYSASAQVTYSGSTRTGLWFLTYLKAS